MQQDTHSECTKRRKQKPEKDSFIEFYIIWPIQDAVQAVAEFIRGITRRITGAWWCGHCKTYHGRRVHKYHIQKQGFLSLYDSDVCSLGRSEHVKESKTAINKDLG